MSPRKPFYLVIPALVGIGIGAASLFGGERERETTIPAGTTIEAVLMQPLSTASSQVGDGIELQTIETVRFSDGAEVPRGTVIRGTVTDVRRGVPPELAIRFTILEFADDELEITTELYRFGTHPARRTGGPFVLPVGHLLKVRLSRPVTIDYRPAPEPAE